MNIASPRYFHTVEALVFILITIWGVIAGQVTVFYILYLFWFQLWVRTIIDILYARKNGQADGKKPSLFSIVGSMFVCFCYLSLIVVFFGFLLNSDNLDLLAINMRTLVLRNIGFDVNMLIFVVQYAAYRRQVGNKDLQIALFDKGHLILHISIILGALIQMQFVKKHPEYFTGYELWGAALVVLPFLLLKILFNSPSFKKIVTKPKLLNVLFNDPLKGKQTDETSN